MNPAAGGTKGLEHGTRLPLSSRRPETMGGSLEATTVKGEIPSFLQKERMMRASGSPEVLEMSMTDRSSGCIRLPAPMEDTRGIS